ncbi:MAG TPA: hypothetical protein VFZ48_04435 [Candidatus Saccharimonadales bacterium]
MGERIATIYYGNETRNGKSKWVQDTMLPDREGLAWHLQDYDIDLALAIPNAADGFDRVWRPEFDPSGSLTGGQVEQVTALGLGAVILDRHSNGYGTKHLESPAPRVNETAVQVFGADKYAAYTEIHGQLPEAIPTYLLANIDAALDDIQDGPFIAKPITGSMGRGIHSFASKAALVEWATALTKVEREAYILQPKYDFTGPLARVRPYTYQDAIRTSELNKSDLSKEVRVYTFHNPHTGAMEFSAVPRCTTPSATNRRAEDHWFFADQEPLLERLARPAGETAYFLARAAGVVAVYISVDFGYGARGDEAPDWRLIEANTRFPYLLGPDKHPELSAHIRDQFARHVNRVIETAA